MPLIWYEKKQRSSSVGTGYKMSIFSEIASILMFVGMIGIANYYQPIPFPAFKTSVFLFCLGLISYGVSRVLD